MRHPGCLALFATFLVAFLFPIILVDVMTGAIEKLGISTPVAVAVVLGILLGGFFNIPVYRYERHHAHDIELTLLFGLGWTPRFVTRTTTVICVNVGGCVIPCLLSLYEIARVAQRDLDSLLVLILVTGICVLTCYLVAVPVRGVGIAMPAIVAPLVAAVSSLALIPDFAPPVAFTAGTLGTVIGADLLHLRDIRSAGLSFASIGGAGTFDGIVLSGILAALLA
jgi:uncharacterized membrane protein